MYSRIIALVLLASLVFGCAPSPKPIDYGADFCDFCRMTIVDQQHAAELVSQKGKVFKFDAIECMIQYKQENKETPFALSLVNDYLEPGVLVDATQCSYLISPAIPSPMGANLSAFLAQKSGARMQQEHGGELYAWDSIQTQIGTH